MSAILGRWRKNLEELLGFACGMFAALISCWHSDMLASPPDLLISNWSTLQGVKEPIRWLSLRVTNHGILLLAHVDAGTFLSIIPRDGG